MTTLNYKDAGVNIDAGDAFVKQIIPMAHRTLRPEVLEGLGGFGGLFELPIHKYKNPVLVSSTDGVGTKLKLAQRLDRHDTIGIDLVAMCVNDIIVSGAEPLFFLDYYATGNLKIDAATQIIQGIANGCHQAGCALIGGETAEMPGLYTNDDYDLAGFAVGILEKTAILGAKRVQIGDALIGIAASGPHSNGYSLIRKILDLLDLSNDDLQQNIDGQPLGTALLTPTRIYVKSILNLLKITEIHALAHITGGGLLENIPRILPPNTQALIDLSTWQRPAIFKWLQTTGNIAEMELLRTFNCGVGMVLVVPEHTINIVIDSLMKHGEHAWQLGIIKMASSEASRIVFQGQAR
ncbi:phosphoribosylaminoimidazole synthetase [Achromatium sp. WMS3]|nr:phosphoribosylaminoimidazole synthetase [Achromatium sp. WMS3]